VTTRTRCLIWLGLGLALLTSVACGTTQSVAQSDDPRAVVDRFLAAREGKNLDAAMDCFGDQPEMRSSLGVGWTGRDVVRAIMSYRLLDTYTVGDRTVYGNRVIWSEHVRRGVAGSLSANFDEDVEAVVGGGHILSLVVYVGGTHPPLPTELSPAPSPSTSLLVPISILLLVAGAVLIWPPSTPLAAPRPANGHLLSGLREYVDRRG
jgi:hypothetical protein